jgi:hypothetical protein
MSRVACFFFALAIAPAAAADPTSAKAGMCAAFKAVEKKARVADGLLHIEEADREAAEAGHVLRFAPNYELALSVMRVGLDKLEQAEKRGDAGTQGLILLQGARACAAAGVE